MRARSRPARGGADQAADRGRRPGREVGFRAPWEGKKGPLRPDSGGFGTTFCELDRTAVKRVGFSKPAAPREAVDDSGGPVIDEKAAFKGWDPPPRLAACDATLVCDCAFAKRRRRSRGLAASGP